MPMSGPTQIDLTEPSVVEAFKHSLYVTSVYWIIGLALAALIGAFVTRRVGSFNLSPAGLAEPRSRTYLRFAFGLIWLVDGILQFQPAMPLGLASRVVQPMAVGTPSWLHSWMLSGVGIWNNHPIALAVGTAWIQVGLGIALLVSNGVVGRLAAAASVGWAAMIWLIGNGAGGVFQSTGSFLFGWPGATLFYVVAGIWLVLPPSVFQEKFRRLTLRGLAIVALLAAVLQCLPDRGFWHGGNANALTAMTQAMTATAQPHWLAWFVRHVGVIAGRMGGGFNIVVILWLAVCAVGLWNSASRDQRWPVWTFIAGCVFFWFVAEDAAIFGGVATDLNSLIPVAALAWCAMPARRDTPLARRLPREMRSSSGAVFAAFASAMIVFSAVSMVWASTGAATESTEFIAAEQGTAVPANTVAPGFSLTDQHGQTYSLGEHRGYYTLLTFLDPVCWTDCPLLAGQLRQVQAELPRGTKLDVVAVTADVYYRTLPYLNHFIAVHDMGHVANFYFVTGSLPALKKVWNSWGIGVEQTRTDAMSIHSDYMFIVNPQGRLKWIIPDDPPSNWSGQNSAASELIGLLRQAGLR